MIAEGCADTLRTKHLHQLLQCISRGIISEQQVYGENIMEWCGRTNLNYQTWKKYVELFNYSRQLGLRNLTLWIKRC